FSPRKFVNDGLRKSQSTNKTFRPALAILAAKLRAILDLPSLAKADTIPNVRVSCAMCLRSMATLMFRSASDAEEKGSSLLTSRPGKFFCRRSVHFLVSIGGRVRAVNEEVDRS